MAVATMIAGPNGSGKSTLTIELQRQGYDFGIYLNADDIAKGLVGPPGETAVIAQEEVRTKRSAALGEGISYTFETVMSHHSHIEHFQQARLAGFETRLIFVATEAPSINLGRVTNRVRHGGHTVPPDRIESRYYRCLENLPGAIQAADRTMIFDNSLPDRPLRKLAEIGNGQLRHIDVKRRIAKIDLMDLPLWWLATLKKFAGWPHDRDGPL